MLVVSSCRSETGKGQNSGRSQRGEHQGRGKGEEEGGGRGRKKVSTSNSLFELYANPVTLSEGQGR